MLLLVVCVPTTLFLKIFVGLEASLFFLFSLASFLKNISYYFSYDLTFWVAILTTMIVPLAIEPPTPCSRCIRVGCDGVCWKSYID